MKNKSEFFKVNLIFFIMIIGFVLVRMFVIFDVLKFNEKIESYLFNIFIQVGLMFLLPLILFSIFNKQKPKETFKDFRLNKISFKTIIISIGIGFCVYVLNIFIASFFAMLLSLLGYVSPSSGSVETSWINMILGLVFVAVLPGFCEEFTHRGMLMRGFRVLGIKKMIVMSAVMFGLMHMNISQFFYATIIGIILALVTISSASIIPAMIIHFINNALNVYLPFSLVKGLPFGTVVNVISRTIFALHPVATALILITIFTGLVYLLIYLVKLLFKETFSNKFVEVKREIIMEKIKSELLGIEIEEPKKEPGFVFEEEINIEGGKKYLKITIPFKKFGIDFGPVYKPKFYEKLFYYSTLFLGITVTVFTFVWGVI